LKPLSSPWQACGLLERCLLFRSKTNIRPVQVGTAAVQMAIPAVKTGVSFPYAARMPCLVYGLLLLCMPLSGLAQRVQGRVNNASGEALQGAHLLWIGTQVGTTTDSLGQFALSTSGIREKIIVVSYVGYQTDTLSIGNSVFLQISLQRSSELREVEIGGRRAGILISDQNPIKTEQITQAELSKAACCDLAGCFETQNTVQPQTTNVVTNAKELRILGLSGVYNQVLIDGFPMIQGLSYTYGISSVPGSLVENIYVAKGANSVLQGFESISGQINVETKAPDGNERLYLNAYINNFMERHVNANYSFKQGKWHNLTALHLVQPANKIDRDNDNFLDLPLLTRYLLSSRWKYGDEAAQGWSSQLGVRYLKEGRTGGQIPFDAVNDAGSTSVYGQRVLINQPEFWSKTAFRMSNAQRLVFYASAFHQQQESWFGTASYKAKQNNLYANLQYELSYGKHDFKSGISYRHLQLGEQIAFSDTFLLRSYDGHYLRTEHIPGLFAENSMRFFNNKLQWIAGIRLDHHNQFGPQFTPRTLLKYDLNKNTILRANLGTGWRTVNLFSENIGLLSSSRNILFTEALLPEQAINSGLNLTRKFDSKNESYNGHFSFDFYHTRFSNQIFPDYDTDPTLAIVQNFTGISISNGFQAEAYVMLLNQFEFKTGYNFLDVYRVINTQKQLLPFNPRHKLLGSFSYKPLNNRFQADMNVHWYGRQRLPNTQGNPAEHQRPDFSETFTIINLQFTYHFKKFEVYLGCENIFDFRQIRPIISWQDPFSRYFDTSSVWGPTRGREFYLGVRYRLKKSAVGA
jgi:outer membrane receptor for ferrienterochelin and colicins